MGYLLELLGFDRAQPRMPESFPFFGKRGAAGERIYLDNDCQTQCRCGDGHNDAGDYHGMRHWISEVIGQPARQPHQY